jgi:hypothetical protein
MGGALTAVTIGQQGVINAGQAQDPSYTSGNLPDITFTPIATTTLTNQEIYDRIWDFANSYDKDYTVFGWQTCQDFQKDLMSNVGLIEPWEWY